MKKRMKALVMLGVAIAMLCSGMLLFASSGTNDRLESNYGAVREVAGLTELDPHYISTAAQLNTLVRDRAHLGECFELTADIDLSGFTSWTPIPLLANGGVFNGAGYTIRNMRLTAGTTAGLFANLNGTVKNLSFENITADGRIRGTVAGVVVSTTSAAVTAKIENVRVVSGTMTASGSSSGFAANACIGGLVGGVGVTTSGAAKANGTGTVTLDISKSYSQIDMYTTNGNAGRNGRFGGLIGRVSNSTVNISYSYNSGGILSALNNSSQDIVVGGLVGDVLNGAFLNIEWCFNEGAIGNTGSGGGSAYGGLVGRNGGFGGTTGTNGTITINNSASVGPISSASGGVSQLAPGFSGTGNIYQVPKGPAAQEIIDKIIEGIKGAELTITRPASGDHPEFIFVPVSHLDDKIYVNDVYSFKVELKSGYTQVPSNVTLDVKVDGATIAGQQGSAPNNHVWTYSVTQVSDTVGIVVTVSVTGINKYTVKLDADSTAMLGTSFNMVAELPAGQIVNHNTAANLKFEFDLLSGYTGNQPVVRINGTAVIVAKDGNVADRYSYTIPSVTSDIDITILPIKDEFTITTIATGGGTIDPTRTSSGGLETFNFVSNDDTFFIQSVIVDGTHMATTDWTATVTNGKDGGYYTFPNVQTSHTIQVIFAKKTYSITSSIISGSGTITQTASNIPHGEDRTFTINASTGWHISEITVNGTKLERDKNDNAITYGNSLREYSYTFNSISANGTIEVTFSKNLYTITTSITGSGTINPVGPNVSVEHFDSQPFTITAASGWHIASIIVSGVNNGNPISGLPYGNGFNTHTYTFDNISGSGSIAVTFAQNKYAITASVNGTGGTITPSGTTSYTHGATQVYTMTPANSSYRIASVLVNDAPVTTDGTYTFSGISANATIVVTFELIPFTVTSSVISGDGTMSPLGAQTVYHSGSISFTMQADPNNHIKAIYIDGAPLSSLSYGNSLTRYTYTFSNVTAAKTIAVEFEINKYIITASAGTNGSISPNGDISVDHGSNPASFAMMASTNYRIKAIYVDGALLPLTYDNNLTSYIYAFSNVTADATIHVEFTIKTYTVTASSGGNGGISPFPTVIANHGDRPTFTFTPLYGYEVNQIQIGSDSPFSHSSNTYQFATGVAADTSIHVTFKLKTYNISIESPIGGSVSATVGGSPLIGSAHSLTHGTVMTVTITADQLPTRYYLTHYTFDDGVTFERTAVSVDNQTELTFQFTVTCEGTLSAIFTDQAPKTYIISVEVEGSGTVTPSETATAVVHGDDIRFRFIPGTGYHVAEIWVDGAILRAQEFDSALIDGYIEFANVVGTVQDEVVHTLKIVFAVNTYTIAATAGPNGNISPSGNIGVAHFSDEEFEITANTNYHISAIRVNGQLLTLTYNNLLKTYKYEFTDISGDGTIEVEFAIDTFTINATAGSNGTISPASAAVDHNGSYTFTFTPATGYKVDTIKIGDAPAQAYSGTTYRFTNVTADTRIHVTFSLISYTITADVTNGNGTISPSGACTVYHFGTQAFVITADTGWHIASITVTDGAVQNVSGLAAYTYIFTDIDGNGTISVNFERNTYTVTVSAGTGGTIVLENDQNYPNHPEYKYEDTPTFTIDAAEGWHIASIRVNGILQTGTNFPYGNDFETYTYTFLPIASNGTIVVTFAIKTHTITVLAGANGTIEPAGPSITADHFSSRSFSIQADASYHIESILIDGIEHELDAGLSYGNNLTRYTYTFERITSARMIECIFALNTYTITSKVSGGEGTISPTQSNISHGASNVSFAINASTGWHIASITVTISGQQPDAIAVTDPSAQTYTFTSVTSNAAIQVTFAINTYTITANVTPVSGVAGGAVSPGNRTVNYGDRPEFTFIPLPGYVVETISVDGGSPQSYTGTTYKFESITWGPRTIAVTFALVPYSVAVETGYAQYGKEVTVNGNLVQHGSNFQVKRGDRITIIATPKSIAYAASVWFDDVRVAGTIQADGRLVITNFVVPTLDAFNTTLRIEFEPRVFKITTQTTTQMPSGDYVELRTSTPDPVVNILYPDITCEDGNSNRIIALADATISAYETTLTPEAIKNYAFNDYLVRMPNGGYSILGHDFGVVSRAVTEDFLALHGSMHAGLWQIEIIAVYVEQHTITVDFLDEAGKVGSSGGTFKVYYNNAETFGFDEELKLVAGKKALPLGTEISIAVTPFKGYKVKVDESTDAPNDILDSIRGSFTGSVLAALNLGFVKDGESYAFRFNLIADIDVEISFEVKAKSLVRIVLDTNDMQILDAEGNEIEAKSNAMEIFPDIINYVGLAASESGITGYKFEQWAILTTDGAITALDELDIAGFAYNFDVTSGLLSDITLPDALLQAPQEGDEEDTVYYLNENNEIVLVAVFRESVELTVSVIDNPSLGSNTFTVYFNGSPVLDPGNMNFDDGDIVEIVGHRQYTDFVDFVGYFINGQKVMLQEPNTKAEITIRGGTNISLIFESKVFTLSIGLKDGEAKGSLKNNNPATFRIGDTLRFSFNAQSNYELSKMFIGDVNVQNLKTGPMVYKNGTLTINVTAAWLNDAVENKWLDLSTRELATYIEVRTKISPMILVGAGIGGVLLIGIIVIIVLSLLSIQSKKKDYAAAKASQEQGMARLKQNIVGDLVK